MLLRLQSLLKETSSSSSDPLHLPSSVADLAVDSLEYLAICLACLVSPGFSKASMAKTNVLSSSSASVDLDECIESLYKKNLLAESVIEAICAKTKELLMQESNVVHVQAPVTVVGDIHGQFFDLIEIFKIGGWCPDTNYLFLGKTCVCQCKPVSDVNR
jgi:hypothetical protein